VSLRFDSEALDDQHVVSRAVLLGQVEQADHAAVGLAGQADDCAGLVLVVVELYGVFPRVLRARAPTKMKREARSRRASRFNPCHRSTYFLVR